MNYKRLEVFLEFLVFGILIGTVEDLIAISLTTEAEITWDVVKIVVLVAIPLAFLGEVLVDKIDFVEIFEKLFKVQKNIQNTLIFFCFSHKSTLNLRPYIPNIFL